jgi:hypothetical protein
VAFECHAQLRVGGALRHLGQRLDDLVFRAVEILDLILEQVVQWMTIVCHVSSSFVEPGEWSAMRDPISGRRGSW